MTTIRPIAQNRPKLLILAFAIFAVGLLGSCNTPQADTSTTVANEATANNTGEVISTPEDSTAPEPEPVEEEILEEEEDDADSDLVEDDSDGEGGGDAGAFQGIADGGLDAHVAEGDHGGVSLSVVGRSVVCGQRLE